MPIEAQVSPLPKEPTTPPVTKICLVMDCRPGLLRCVMPVRPRRVPNHSSRAPGSPNLHSKGRRRIGEGAQPPIARGGPGFVGGAVAGPRSGGHVIFCAANCPFIGCFCQKWARGDMGAFTRSQGAYNPTTTGAAGRKGCRTMARGPVVSVWPMRYFLNRPSGDATFSL